jgi:5-formyltetrahydrofolate cyclo-ligase
LRPDARAARRELRRRIRAERRALSATERKAAVNVITSRILGLGAFVSARRVAVFISFDGEPSLSGLVSAAVRQRKTVYAPVITRSHMEFAELHPDAGLATNFFGISEPDRARTIDPRRLDLVLTPLVAFDDAGTRIGVGRGYYDRCFKFLRGRRSWHRPKLLGVAYELQHVQHVPAEPWDVPLWGVVTEAKVRRFRHG